ncbi:MAG: hypothetical protein HY360_18270 [Verrucomicrobia bacterium]|nr:hypothetical protein [Verrucomicrobiota bacterium]
MQVGAIQGIGCQPSWQWLFARRQTAIADEQSGLIVASRPGDEHSFLINGVHQPMLIGKGVWTGSRSGYGERVRVMPSSSNDSRSMSLIKRTILAAILTSCSNQYGIAFHVLPSGQRKITIGHSLKSTQIHGWILKDFPPLQAAIDGFPSGGGDAGGDRGGK